MKLSRLVLPVGMIVILTASLAFSAGDAERGKKLFHDPKFAAGTTGKSCNSCHPAGKGLETTGSKKEWHMMGKTYKSLEEVINYDIEKALHGKALDPKSQEMADIIAYIKSLAKK